MSSQPAIVLITGANQGIGFQIAKLLAESSKPYTILIGSRNTDNGNTAASKLLELNPKNTNIKTIQIDIVNESSIEAAVEKVEEDYGRLDILINNAAIPGMSPATRPLSELSAVWSKVLTTNVTGTVICTEAFLPLLRKSQDPRIIIVSSSIGSLSLTEAAPQHPLLNSASPYRASKAAINIVLIEWNKLLKGIRVWGVDPGLCATDFGGDYSRTNGRDPKEGADIVRQCAEGERDECVGKVVWEQNGETGVRPW